MHTQLSKELDCIMIFSSSIFSIDSAYFSTPSDVARKL